MQLDELPLPRVNPADPHVIAAAIRTVYSFSTDPIDRMELLFMLELDD